MLQCTSNRQDLAAEEQLLLSSFWRRLPKPSFVLGFVHAEWKWKCLNTDLSCDEGSRLWLGFLGETEKALSHLRASSKKSLAVGRNSSARERVETTALLFYLAHVKGDSASLFSKNLKCFAIREKQRPCRFHADWSMDLLLCTKWWSWMSLTINSGQ